MDVPLVSGITSAIMSELPMDRSPIVKTPTIVSRNDQANSASPTTKKVNQRSNGKSLPPLKRNVQFPK